MEMEMAQDQSRIAELGRQIDAHEHVVREESVGWDRHWNRYWILGSNRSDRPGDKTSRALGQAIGGAAIADEARTGCIMTCKLLVR